MGQRAVCAMKIKALAMRPTVAGRMPARMLWTVVLVLNLSRKAKTKRQRMKEGSATANVAIQAPERPATLKPT